MPIAKLSPAYLKEFEEKVQQAAKKFPEIVRIRHSFDEDWTGEPAIYFRIVLSDDVGLGGIGEVGRRIRESIPNDLEIYETDYLPFFYFRLKAEEDRVREPEWE